MITMIYFHNTTGKNISFYQNDGMDGIDGIDGEKPIYQEKRKITD